MARNLKHRAQFLSTLETYAFPEMGDVPVADIDIDLVAKVLRPIWETKTETASRVRGRIEAVLDYAKVHKYREGDNPAQWKGQLAHVLPKKSKVSKVEHHAALQYPEMSTFMAELADREGIAARALEVLILHSSPERARSFAARWSEFDLPADTWTIPAERMKAGKEHRVTLPARAVAILEALPREGDFVFPGMLKGMALSNMAMNQLLKRMERKGITVHGFRSTFKDWASETTNHPDIVSEAPLAAHDSRQGAGRLSPWRTKGEASALDGRLGAILLRAEVDRRDRDAYSREGL